MRVGLLLAGLPLVLATTDAHACKLPYNDSHSIDEEEVGLDETPPGEIAGVDVGPIVIDRGGDGCGECGSGTSLELTITPGSDDRTDPGALGHVVELIEGELPFPLPDGPVRGHTIYFRSNSTRSQRVSAVLEVRAVDRAGNVGPATRVEIDDRASGCRVAPLSGFGAAWLAIFALHLLGRRRRAARQQQENETVPNGRPGAA